MPDERVLSTIRPARAAADPRLHPAHAPEAPRA